MKLWPLTRRRLLGVCFISALVASMLSLSCSSAPNALTDDNPLLLPTVGSHQLRLLGPSLLELTLVTTQKPNATSGSWDFVNAQGRARLPAVSDFNVSAAEKVIPVQAIGFKRRVLYAPLKQRDLRIGNYLYLQLAGSVAEGQTVEVKNPSGKLWMADRRFVVKAEPFRWSPLIHVNQTGYLPSAPKKAMIGYYLGSMGELKLEQCLAPQQSSGSTQALSFQIVDSHAHKQVFQGRLVARPDSGFPFASYKQVFEADFTEVKTPGEYLLFVPGIGTSFPFVLDEGVAGAFARAYALGVYHQRCGTANELPFTRFTHQACHTAPAEVPDTSKKFESVNQSLEKESANFKDMPRHTARQLKNVSASLYPFINRGPVDVHGGHHDAGDYSKYTVNSAALVHHLVFAADVFPGVAALDNLGLPESGDGKSDILQEAKWEADFLSRMQDADGGFYFLVYPRDREYEIDVLPDKSDPQVVFPKTTSVTAAATAALAQSASSPTFKKQFPEAAAKYLQQAKNGWAFLEKAIAKFGKDGAYQKITHYGDYFMHDDELAWAACEMFVATGEEIYQKKLIEWFDPADANTRMWSWWRLFDAYGSTIRSYAFAVKAGKLKREQLEPLFLERCELEIVAAGEDQLRRARNSAYGTSFPEETKSARTAGWYFSGDAAYDLAVAYQLDYPVKNDPRPQLFEAMISNLNYEQGCNPVNVTYLTGLGWKRQREVVHQYAQNDRRTLPLTGIPLGNIQGGFGWLEFYKKELGELSFPADSSEDAPYPFYDRWGDSFNLTQEFVMVNQARALAYLSWLMARTPLTNQTWKAAPAQITGLPSKIARASKVNVEFSAPGFDLQSARVVWETPDSEPAFGKTFNFIPTNPGQQWLEAEAQLPDGRRLFAVTNFSVGR